MEALAKGGKGEGGGGEEEGEKGEGEGEIPVVSVLEGGYDLVALVESVEAHVDELLKDSS